MPLSATSSQTRSRSAPAVYDNPPTVWGILDGVGEDIHNHLQNPLPVPPNIGQSFRSLQ